MNKRIDYSGTYPAWRKVQGANGETDTSPVFRHGMHGLLWDKRCEHCRDGAELRDGEPHSETLHLHEIHSAA